MVMVTTSHPQFIPHSVHRPKGRQATGAKADTLKEKGLTMFLAEQPWEASRHQADFPHATPRLRALSGEQAPAQSNIHPSLRLWEQQADPSRVIGPPLC